MTSKAGYINYSALYFQNQEKDKSAICTSKRDANNFPLTSILFFQDGELIFKT